MICFAGFWDMPGLPQEKHSVVACWFISSAPLLASQNALIVIGPREAVRDDRPDRCGAGIHDGLVQRGLRPMRES